jgi:hypothetical protein
MAGYKGDMLDPEGRGMTPARRKMIHKHREYADKHGPELPFKLGIFKSKLGNKPKNVEVVCDCGNAMWVTAITVMVTCNQCKRLVSVDV